MVKFENITKEQLAVALAGFVAFIDRAGVMELAVQNMSQEEAVNHLVVAAAMMELSEEEMTEVFQAGVDASQEAFNNV